MNRLNDYRSLARNQMTLEILTCATFSWDLQSGFLFSRLHF